MAKIYSYDEYKLRQLIKKLKNDLSYKLHYCEMYGYMWMDHYTIKTMNDKINELIAELERMKNERPS